MQQPIQTAVSAGIPVILVDTTLKDQKEGVL
jgi:ABC-type sugar transport system substrate-binding protein